MRGKHALRLTICATALVFVLDARAEDQFRKLDGKQIRTRVVGQDITDGPHWSMYFRPDGTLISSESGSSWTGSWKIQNDKLCMTMPSSTSLVCHEVWMSGAYIRMRANKDEETFDARVMAHQTKQ
ncbi:heat shock protein HslJ [Bradyrhizobium sp. LA7.1]